MRLVPSLLQGFACGRWDEAIARLRALQERDQLSGYAAAILVIGYAAAANCEGDITNRTALAQEWAEKAMAREADALLSPWAPQLALQSVEDWEESFKGATVFAHDGLDASAESLGMSLALSGDVAGSRSVYDEMRLQAVREYVPPTCLALLAASIGEPEKAIVYGRESVRRHDRQLVIFEISWAVRYSPHERSVTSNHRPVDRSISRRARKPVGGILHIASPVAQDGGPSGAQNERLNRPRFRSPTAPLNGG